MKLRHNSRVEILLCLTLTALVQIKQTNTSESAAASGAASHTNYLSLNSNNFLNSYASLLGPQSQQQQQSHILESNLLNDSYATIFGGMGAADASASFSNISADSFSSEHESEHLKMKLFTKYFLCKSNFFDYLGICFPEIDHKINVRSF